MQFFSSLLVGAAALSSFVAAQSTSLFITSEISSVIAGRPVDIEYAAADLNEPVTILLRYGPTGDLVTEETITSDATGGSYTWTPSLNLPNRADYTFEISQGSETNFAPIRFELTGGSEDNSSSTPISSMSITSAPSSVATSAVETTIITVPSNTTMLTTTPTTRPSSTAPTGGSTSAPSDNAPAPTGAASTLGSPAALVLGAIAALAYLQ